MNEQAVAFASVAFSVALGLCAAVLVVRRLNRLPADFFVRSPPAAQRGRRIMGAIALVLGLLMLVLPGPGIAMTVLGLALLDVPFHRRATAWLLRRPRVRAALDKMRKRAGAEPFQRPDDDSHTLGGAGCAP